MVPQPHRFSLRFLTYLWWFNHTRVLFQTGEGYAAIHRAACSGGWGQSDESCAGFVTTQSIAFNYVKASAPYRYNWCLEQVMSGFLKNWNDPYVIFRGLGKDDLWTKTQSKKSRDTFHLIYTYFKILIAVKVKCLWTWPIFLDSQQSFRKVCKTMDFETKRYIAVLLFKIIAWLSNQRSKKYG